jgi:release factor glutamine methyltransferase
MPKASASRLTPVAAGTVAEALAAARDALAAAGVETPRLDAEVLLAEALGVERSALLTRSEEGVDPSAGRRFGEFVRRRVRREPVAYIIGRKAFRRIAVAVDRRVLIPRPETELLVEVALELEPASVLDVGTGSGAIALAVRDELPESRVQGIDISAGAIDVARGNAERLGLGGEGGVTFEVVAPSFAYGKTKRQDLVVANLPYVSEAEWVGLAPEIREYEPREALLGGSDGLQAIRSFLADPPECDTLALEVGAGQAAEVEALVTEAGFTRTERRRDLAGIERVVLGRR